MSKVAPKKANTKFLRGQEIQEAENLSFIKKQKRKPNTGLSQFQLKEIHPLTENQGKLFKSYGEGKNIIASGSAGTGKSFCLLYLMLQDLVYTGDFDKLLIFRSAVATRNIGFLPGSEEEKLQAYELPYKNILNEIFGRADAYEIMKKKDLVEFLSTSYVRGTTFDNSLILVDEIQNLNFHEACSLITRVGKNTRIFFSGDDEQCDFYKTKEESCYSKLFRIFENMESVSLVNFGMEDIVRSGFVKEFLIAKYKTNL